jgi:uncharacterized protein YbjT (DUF2867 family)
MAAARPSDQIAGKLRSLDRGGRDLHRTEDQVMKIVVIGGTRLIGTKLVNRLRAKGHEVAAASPALGVNTITGEGLAEVLAGAQVVVDVANSPSFEAKAALEFFETSGHNLLAAQAAAGVGHHLVLSVVGTERLLENGYFRAKMAQEKLIKASGIPYTILRSTQFFEFIRSIIESGADGDVIRPSPALWQPVESDDVAAALAELVVGAPLNGTIEVAGPRRVLSTSSPASSLAASGDRRRVIADVHASYFGILLNDRSLAPGDHPRVGAMRFEDWLSRTPPHRHASDRLRPGRTRGKTLLPLTQSNHDDEHHRHHGRYGDLLQGLGQRPGRDLLARLATELGRLGRPDSVPGATRLSLRSDRPTSSRPLKPAIGAQRHGRLCRRSRGSSKRWT